MINVPANADAIGTHNSPTVMVPTNISLTIELAPAGLNLEMLDDIFNTCKIANPKNPNKADVVAVFPKTLTNNAIAVKNTPISQIMMFDAIKPSY